MNSSTICRNDSDMLDATLQVNGDIAGPGVRLSFYLQTFVLVLLVDRSPEDAPGSLWTLTATSCGLTVAAIAQVATRRLSLLEALIVSQLVWLANVASFIAHASYSRSKSSDTIVKFATVAQGYLSMVLTIAMWSCAEKLGKYPECNHLVNFVVMFVETPALGPGRIVALVFASLMFCGYTYLTLKELRAWRQHTVTRKEKHIKRRHSHRQSIGGSVRSIHNQPTGPHSRWLPADIDPKFIGVVLAETIIFAYFLATTELIIKYTGVPQEANHDWGFGQASTVFAIMVITPSVVALWRGIKRRGVAGRQRQALGLTEEGRITHVTEHPAGRRHSDSGLRPPNHIRNGSATAQSISSISSRD